LSFNHKINCVTYYVGFVVKTWLWAGMFLVHNDLSASPVPHIHLTTIQDYKTLG